MGKFEVIEHPLVQHKLTMIRDKNVGTKFCLRGFQEYAAQRS